MPWNDQSNGPGDRGGGPWGGGPRQPWGQPPRQPQGGGPGNQGGQGPDLEDMLRRARERFGTMGGGRFGGRGGRAGRGLNPGAVAGIVGGLWLLTGVYIVDEGEQGVVSRFGAYEDTVTPGLHWHLPLPIESVRVISVSSLRTLDIGVGEDSASQAVSLMISGDRSIVDVDFRVTYRLSNARDYLYNISDPEAAVRGLAESAMREIIGQRELQAIITTERTSIEQAVQTQLQTVLNSYSAGIDIVSVSILNAAPPTSVVEAFTEVVRAGSDAETAINRATEYANEVVPRARGEASQITQAAEAYAEQAVREANGEAQRFTLVEQQYRAAPRVTRERLYLEAMERIYRGADTVIIDRNAGAVPILPLDQLRRQNRAGGAAPAAPATAAPAQPQPGAR